MDPPPENGIAVNFGTSTTGKGEVQPTTPIKSAPISEVTPPTPTPPENDNTLTQEDDSPVVVTPKDKKKTKKDTPKETKPVKNPVDNNKEKVKETPKKPSKTTNNALDAFINGPKSDGDSKSGHGDDATAGDKGKIDGSIYANSFYGNGSGNGSGNGTGWGLKGRKLAGNSKKIQDCNESGRVVVKVWVNRQGNVTRAEPTQGTTNNDNCLIQPALQTAKSFKWQPDSKAPKTQIGFVVINFSVGE